LELLAGTNVVIGYSFLTDKRMETFTMTKRLMRTVFTGAICLLVLGTAVQAQNKGDLVLRVMGGLSTYGGDNDQNPEEEALANIDGTVSQYFEDAGFMLGAELGYGITNGLSVALRGVYGRYPLIEAPVNGLDEFAFPSEDENRLMGVLLLRYRFLHDKKVNPYLHIGGNLTKASQWYDDGSVAYGPSGGFGFQFNLSEKLALILDWTTNLTTPDAAVDGRDPGTQTDYIPEEEDHDETDFDYLTHTSLGLLFTLVDGDACKMVDVLSANGPASVDINRAAAFSGETNLEASEPVAYFWDFGDGNTATGTAVSHSYTEAGTYTVTYSASNCGGTDAETLSINVIDPCATNMPDISSSNVPSNLETGASGSFSAASSGSGLTYSWNFGDGTTGTGRSATHTYRTAGTYTVTLEVRNECGVDTQTFRVTVVDPRDPCDDITELNTVYFNFRSVDLDDDAKRLLDENIAVLNDCPGICVNINGYSDTVERSQRLSEQRARNVLDYYLSMGVDASRLTSAGLGIAEPPCNKEDPGAGCRRNRRAESVPVRCDRTQQEN
jgi:outer membrane protein OmpA-like peptidoglycan-associated protein